MTSWKWRKLGLFLSGQIVANTELQNKQDLVFCPFEAIFSAYRWCALLGGHEGGGCKHSSVQGQHPPAGGNRGWNCSGTNLQLARVCQPCLQAVAWHQALGTFSLLRRSSRYGVLQNDHRWCRGGEAAGYIQQQVNRLAPMPNVLPPPLLSRERHQYLFNNIREYIQEDVVCPKTLLSLDVLRHGSQGL